MEKIMLMTYNCMCLYIEAFGKANPAVYKTMLDFSLKQSVLIFYK